MIWQKSKVCVILGIGIRISMQLPKGIGFIEQNYLPNRNASWVLFFWFDLPNELQLLFALFIRLSQDKGWPLNWINKAKAVSPCLKGR